MNIIIVGAGKVGITIGEQLSSENHNITIIDLNQKKVEEAYKDKERWAKMALLNTACCGKFTSDRTIQEYVDDIWHLDKVTVEI